MFLLTNILLKDHHVHSLGYSVLKYGSWNLSLFRIGHSEVTTLPTLPLNEYSIGNTLMVSCRMAAKAVFQ